MSDLSLNERLYLAAKSAGCTCDYERTKGGVPIWFPMEGGGIGRKLIRQCARCATIDDFEKQFPRPVAA